METTVFPQQLTDNTAWFRQWFNSSFYHALYANRSEHEAANFIDNLLQQLRPAAGSHMLDLGCGNGRHSKFLAAHGFHVTGLDLAASSIRTAKQLSNPRLQFRRHDMRDPFGTACFDYVFNFFTSFGYFKTKQEDDLVISNIAASLRSGGTFVMDYINSACAEKKLVAAETKEIDGIIYDINRHSDERYFYKTISLHNLPGGQPLEYTEQVSKFSLEAFDTLFKRHGLCIQQVYGDYTLADYHTLSSPRLIMVAEKTK